jgi:hypothetical protein
MANIKYTQRNVRKIIKTGGSLSISLPVEFLAELGWKERQKVVVRKIRGGISIKDWK